MFKPKYKAQLAQLGGDPINKLKQYHDPMGSHCVALHSGLFFMLC